MKPLSFFSSFIVIASFFSATSFGHTAIDSVLRGKCKVIREIPHDKTNWTEGLIYQDGFLIESTGRSKPYPEKGTISKIERIDVRDGTVVQSFVLPETFAAEGITAFNGSLVQLSFLTNQGFHLDATTFQEVSSFAVPTTEAWGLTNDGNHLIFSDGTSTLHYMNPSTHEITRNLEVTYNGVSFPSVNELEYVNGELYGNVWIDQKIMVISPDSGAITKEIDCSELAKQNTRLLNGIAYDHATQHFYITGKKWGKIYEVVFEF